MVEALATAFQDLDRWEDILTANEALETFLSEEHRDAPGTGCALGALLGDMSRASRSAKAVYTARLKRTLAYSTGLVLQMATLIGAPVRSSRLVQCWERSTSLVLYQTRTFHERFFNGLAMS